MVTNFGFLHDLDAMLQDIGSPAAAQNNGK